MFKLIKNIFKTIWANKNSIFALVTSIAGILVATFIVLKDYILGLDFWWLNYIKDITPAVEGAEAVVNGLNLYGYVALSVFAAIIVGFDIYGIINKYGWEGIEEFANRMQEKKVEAEAKLVSKEQQAEYKEKMAIFNRSVKEIDAKIKKLESQIKSVKTLVDSGLATTEQSLNFKNLQAELSNLLALKDNYKSKIAEL